MSFFFFIFKACTAQDRGGFSTTIEDFFAAFYTEISDEGRGLDFEGLDGRGWMVLFLIHSLGLAKVFACGHMPFGRCIACVDDQEVLLP